MKLKVMVWVATNRVGSRTETEFELEVDDDATTEEIESEVEELSKEQMFDLIEWNYKIDYPKSN